MSPEDAVPFASGAVEPHLLLAISLAKPKSFGYNLLDLHHEHADARLADSESPATATCSAA
jgi:hypothetical protein